MQTHLNALWHVQLDFFPPTLLSLIRATGWTIPGKNVSILKFEYQTDSVVKYVENVTWNPVKYRIKVLAEMFKLLTNVLVHCDKNPNYFQGNSDQKLTTHSEKPPDFEFFVAQPNHKIAHSTRVNQVLVFIGSVSQWSIWIGMRVKRVAILIAMRNNFSSPRRYKEIVSKIPTNKSYYRMKWRMKHFPIGKKTYFCSNIFLLHSLNFVVSYRKISATFCFWGNSFCIASFFVQFTWMKAFNTNQGIEREENIFADCCHIKAFCLVCST